MKHPEIVLLPILMFADYFLTVLGAVLRERKYAEHFKVEHYELNPLWQKTIARKQWLNPRHILVTLLMTGVVAGLLELGTLPKTFAEGMLGCLFITYGTVIGRHCNNLLLFWRLARKPTEISGQITMAHALSLSISLYQYLVVALPMLLLAIFSPTPFVLGGLVGIVLLILAHLRWLLRQSDIR
jgi:hypothetical protein